MGIQRTIRFGLLLVLALPLLAAPAAARDDDGKAAVEKYRETIKGAAEDVRLRAVNTLAAVPGKAVGKELRKVVGTDRSERVKAAAAHALGRRGDKQDLRFLVSSLRRLKKMPVALAGAIDGIGEYRNPKTVEVLFDTCRYWMFKHKYPTQAAIRALGKIRAREAIGKLINLYEYTYPSGGFQRGPDGDLSMPGPTGDDTYTRLEECRPWIQEALRGLTGEAIGELGIWKEWWDEHERTFDPESVVPDVNRTLKLVDMDFGYSIVRPDSDWKWRDKPEDGFTRTADLVRSGENLGSLSILTYQTAERSPTTAEEMLAQMKDKLTKLFGQIKEQKWDEAVKVGEVSAVRQTVKGRIGVLPAEIQQTVFVDHHVMFVIRLTLSGWASRTERNSAKEFVDSFLIIG